MRTYLVILLILLVAVAGCGQQTLIIQTQIPGNQTLMNEHECDQPICGTYIDIYETQPAP